MAIETFSDIIKLYEKDFIENPLDRFDSYTYSLEWFVVNHIDTRKFQIQESQLSSIIAKDEWPGPESQYITIAKTAYTTEFNITNLSITSVGVGNANHSKLAGTADKLEFTCTQVGNTSLADSLQAAIALCGYKSISDAVYFIKINFLGADGQKQEKLPDTKVFPFKISAYNQVNTSTDSRGTTTVIAGQVALDESVSDGFLSTIQHVFTYNCGKMFSLKETLDSFFTELNLQIDENNKHLEGSMKNEYSYEFSDQFFNYFSKSAMPPAKKGTTLTGKNNAIELGDSMPGQNIYGTVEEIILKSVDITGELTKDNPSYTRVAKITPMMAMKINGFNPVKGTQAYKVVYYIDFQMKIVEQNMTDFFTKIKNNKANCLSLFDRGHVHKKYDYLFTGNNDQILNFEISLQAELQKTYITPVDSWKNIDFSKDNPSGRKLTDAHKELQLKLKADVKTTQAAYEKTDKAIDVINKRMKEESATYRDKIMAALATKSGDRRFKDIDIEEKYGSMTFEELMTEFKIEEGGVAITGPVNRSQKKMIAGINAHKMRTSKLKLQKQIKELKQALAENKISLTEATDMLNETMQDITATNLLKGETDRMGARMDGYKSSTASMFDSMRDKNTPNIILAEELGDDYITTLSNDDFRTILTAQAQNPIQFESLLYKDASGNFTSSSGDAEAVLQNAKTKYYESKGGELSMVNAQMTIKGDPFFIEGYMPANTKKVLYENGGTLLDKSFSPVTSFANGFPHIVINSGKAKGTDINDNVITGNLILSLYAVKGITSDFSGGLFTQTLSLVKNTSAEHFTKDVVVAEIEELDDVDVVETNIVIVELISEAEKQAAFTANKLAGLLKSGLSLDEATKVIANGELAVRMALDNHMTKNDAFPLGGAYGTGVDGGPPDDTTFKEKLANGWDAITSVFSNSTTNEVKVKPIVDNSHVVLENTAATLGINGNNLTGDLGKHDAPLLDNMVRRNNADDYIQSTRILTGACRGGDESACTEISSAQDALLATIGVTPEEKGTGAAVTKMNNYFNNVIADSGTHADFVLSEEEVAAYSIAVGGELNITGHDQKRIQKIIKKATGERTPNIILEEIKARKYNLPMGASHDNGILNGTDPLLNAKVEGVVINGEIPHWPGDKADLYSADLTAEKTEEGFFKSLISKTVDSTKSFFGFETRKLEIVDIEENTLTSTEAYDVKVLSDEIAHIIDYDSVTSDDVAEDWYGRSSGVLAAQMIQGGLTLDEVARAAMENAQKNRITQSLKIDGLSDDGWVNVEAYAKGINDIAAGTAANGTGTRNNLTDAVNTQTLGETVTNDVATATQLTSKTSGYYFDYLQKQEDIKTLQQVESDIAKNHLALPTVTTTAVRTIVTDGVTEYIPVTTPVSQTKIEYQPILVMPLENASLNTLDVYLPSQRGDELLNKNVSVNEVAQLDQARKVYDLITDIHSTTIEVDDEYTNTKVVVKDYNNLPPLIYVDSTGASKTIDNPSAYFGLYTNTFDDSNPAFMSDYIMLKEKISDLFPSITVGQPTYPTDGTKDFDGLQIYMRESLFYIDKTKPPGSTIW